MKPNPLNPNGWHVSIPQHPEPAKLVVGIILKNKSLVGPVASMLDQAFGSMDMISPWMAFGFTDYYQAEMGGPLFRRMFSFQTLIAQRTLADIKLQTNEIENRHRSGSNRSVNIDPGYLLMSQFVLATGKNYAHRIYLDRGIYADLTLMFSKGGFEPLPWTYPDYKGDEMRCFLEVIRSKYIRDMHHASPPTPLNGLGQ